MYKMTYIIVFIEFIRLFCLSALVCVVCECECVCCVSVCVCVCVCVLVCVCVCVCVCVLAYVFSLFFMKGSVDIL